MKKELSHFRRTISKAGPKTTSSPVSYDKKEVPISFSRGATPPLKEYHSDAGNCIFAQISLSRLVSQLHLYSV